MTSNQKHPKLFQLIHIFSIVCLVFVSPASNATYYGGPYYKHHYGYYGYPYYRPYYRHYYGHHHDRYNAHFGVHSYVSGDAALIVLGVLGAAVLAHVLTNDSTHYRNTYPKTYPYTPPVKVFTPAPAKYQKPVTTKVYSYKENEGWDWLAKGNAGYALDIFAIQSQQNLNSGKPKVGFAISAAAMGEKDRAIRAMRKAVRIDADALDSIDINTVQATVEKLTEDYQTNINHNPVDTDNAFMAATLSYLQRDYVTANTLIAENDQSQSANNLRELLKGNIKTY